MADLGGGEVDGTGPRLVHDLLHRAACDRPDSVAVSDRHGHWTYRELWRASAQFATWLAATGCRPGERVVFQAASTRQSAALLYGCSIGSITAVPVSPKAKPYQLRQVIADAEPTLVIGEGGGPGWISPAEAWTRAQAVAVTAAPAAEPTAPAFLIYTSGSTSAPKGIVAPHTAVLFVAEAIQRMLGYTDADVVFCRVPLSFDYGLYQLLLATLAGARVWLDDGTNDGALLAEIASSGSTVVPLLPSLAGILVALAGRRPRTTSVRLFTNTGEEMAAATAAALRKHFPAARLQLMYGISECKRVSILEPDGDQRRPGSVGRPLPGTRVAIVDGDGREVGPGRTGEIVVYGPHVMDGYWRPAEGDRCMFGDGRLQTGDFGRLDVDGYLFFDGRRDNLYKQNGIRTSTSEVEAAALDVPGVAAAVVLSPTTRRDAVLFVVGTLVESDVLRGLANRLETGKVPRVCIRLNALPLSANGKVDRAALAERLPEGVQ